MIKVQSKYDPSGVGKWIINGKIIFKSNKKRWDRDAYSLSDSYNGPSKLHSGYYGGQPALLGATCLTVWSK